MKLNFLAHALLKLKQTKATLFWLVKVEEKVDTEKVDETLQKKNNNNDDNAVLNFEFLSHAKMRKWNRILNEWAKSFGVR